MDSQVLDAEQLERADSRINMPDDEPYEHVWRLPAHFSIGSLELSNLITRRLIQAPVGREMSLNALTGPIPDCIGQMGQLLTV